MDTAFDLTNMLRNWVWNSEQFNARWVEGDDGRRLIQVRLELGVLQMETTGRPDGLRPEGFDSYLHLCSDRLETDPNTQLSSTVCGALRDESLQVFHRITAALTLGDLQSVMHDADGILRRMDLCRRFQGDSAAFANLESLRPQAIMMRSRAGAELALAAGQQAAARRALSSGLEDLEACLGPTALKTCPEGQVLRSMQALLMPRLPASQRVELQTRLSNAIDRENFELAAILRDEIRQLLD